MIQGRDGGEWMELPVSERLAEYSVPDGECLMWTRSTNRFGHGHLRVRGRLIVAHRVVWERAHGPIPAGMLVIHSCDRPGCIALEHLRLGSHRDNALDKVSRGRLRNGRTAMLDDDTVRTIRRDYAAGTRQADLARRYGTLPSTICLIVNGCTYRHVL